MHTTACKCTHLILPPPLPPHSLSLPPFLHFSPPPLPTDHSSHSSSQYSHPSLDPYPTLPAALVFTAQFVELIALSLDQPLPYPLPRHELIRLTTCLGHSVAELILVCGVVCVHGEWWSGGVVSCCSVVAKPPDCKPAWVQSQALAKETLYYSPTGPSTCSYTWLQS